MNAKNCRAIFQRLKKNNPHPTTELIYQNGFELLISVILSAQATDISVNKATTILFSKANTPEKILALGEKGLKSIIKSIGLFNTKAKNILKTCQLLIDKFKQQVPNNRRDLESLPGVGRKTANVILNTLFNEPTIAVDTHIFRVSNRLGLAQEKTPEKTEKKLITIIPKVYLKDAHHWLVLHGRYVCLARKPKCPECILRDLCEYTHKTT